MCSTGSGTAVVEAGDADGAPESNSVSVHREGGADPTRVEIPGTEHCNQHGPVGENTSAAVGAGSGVGAGRCYAALKPHVWCGPLAGHYQRSGSARSAHVHTSPLSSLTHSVTVDRPGTRLARLAVVPAETGQEWVPFWAVATREARQLAAGGQTGRAVPVRLSATSFVGLERGLREK